MHLALIFLKLPTFHVGFTSIKMLREMQKVHEFDKDIRWR